MSTPKFLYLNLSEHNAEVGNVSNRGLSIRTASGRVLGIPYPKSQAVFLHDEATKFAIAKPDWALQHALNVVCQHDSAMLRIKRDERFTDEGRREPATRAAETAIKTLAAVHQDLRNYEAQYVTNARLHHYAVAKDDPNNVPEFFRKYEMRTWVQSLINSQGVNKALATLVGPLEAGTNPELSLAILNSPIPFDELEKMKEHAQNGWRVIRDKADPETAQKIAAAAELTEWATPWVKTAAGIVKRSACEKLLAPEVFNRMVPAESRELFSSGAD
jgi:hypothetical protein